MFQSSSTVVICLMKIILFCFKGLIILVGCLSINSLSRCFALQILLEIVLVGLSLPRPPLRGGRGGYKPRLFPSGEFVSLSSFSSFLSRISELSIFYVKQSLSVELLSRVNFYTVNSLILKFVIKYRLTPSSKPFVYL